MCSGFPFKTSNGLDMVTRLLHHRIPVLHPGPKLSIPQDLAGRCLFVFERAEGVNNVWDKLSAASKV